MRVEVIRYNKDFEGVDIITSTADFTFIDREDWEHQGEEDHIPATPLVQHMQHIFH